MSALEPQRVTVDGVGPDPRDARLAIGQVIDRYRIDAILGAGGMGVVARARDLDLDRDVALKVALAVSDPVRDQRRAELLLREARAMARLRMRNVRGIHDIGSANGIDYIAMEYVAGVDLAHWLTAPRGIGEIVTVFAAAGRGLAAAHAAGVLHRDFKPSNVLVGEDGEVVVTDFGLSRWLHEPRPADTAGTPRYMAPDADADPDDPRTDQYSFCVALGEALGHATASALAARTRGRLERVVRRGSACRAAERYPSMAAVVAALETATRRPRWPLAIAGLAIAVAAALAFPARSGDPSNAVPISDIVATVVERPVDIELEQARAFADRGWFRSARRHAEAASAMAATRAPRRRAAALYQLGFTLQLEEDTAAARAALETAAQLADEQRDDLLRARALLALFQLAVTRGSELTVAERAERAAAVALARVEPEPRDRARLRFFQGVLDALRGRDAACDRAMAEARSFVTPPTARTLIDWGEILRTEAARALIGGDPNTAIASLRQLVAAADEIGGRDHVMAISGRGQLARVLEKSGREFEAASVMTELRAVGQTAAGAHLLDEILGPPPPSHTVHVAVRDASGAPVAGATVVAATQFHANGLSMPGAAALYTERQNAAALAVSDARGIADLAVADHTPLWFAAEHAGLGRSASVLAPAGDPIDLVLAPWGALSGTAPPGASISLTPEQQPGAPPIVLRSSAQGRFSSGHIPRGRYTVAFCVDLQGRRPDDAARCGARSVTISPVPSELALSLATGTADLVVRPRDELARPIESSVVVLAPADYVPDDLHAFQTGWNAVVAHRPEAFAAWVTVHGTTAAQFASVPAGRYSLCAAAIHGDTEDPAFASRLEARQTPLPLFCTSIAVGKTAIERDLVIPASRRVWLGDEPRGQPRTP